MTDPAVIDPSGTAATARPSDPPDPLAAGTTLRLPLTRAPWRACAYLASYLPAGPAFLAATLVVAVPSALLNITWLGLPLLVGVSAITRGLAEVERRRAGLVGPPVPSAYRPVACLRLLAAVAARWRDPATWRDLAYLVALAPPLLILDAVALLAWLVVFAGITLPLWYWAVTDNGRPGVGIVPVGPGQFLFWVDSPGSALLATVVCAALAVPAAHLLVAAARLHRWTARTVLGPVADPLGEARHVLASPGPLARSAHTPTETR